MKSHRLIISCLITLSVFSSSLAILHSSSVNLISSFNFQDISQTPSLSEINPTETATELPVITSIPVASATLSPDSISTPSTTPETPIPTISATNGQEITGTFTPTSTPTPTSTSTLAAKAADEVPLLIKVESDKKQEVTEILEQDYSIETDPNLDQIQILIVNVPEDEKKSIKSSLKLMDGIEYIEENYEVHALGTYPNDPLLSYQYGLETTGIHEAWNEHPIYYAPATIAILDSGIDLTSSDFAGRVLSGYDFVNNDSVAQDDFGHGTHVAGIAAAGGNDGSGIAGIAWNALVLPIKVLDNAGDGSYANVAKGIIFAADNGAEIINLSLGGSKYSQVLEDVVTYATQHGSILVASSGNAGLNQVYYPAALANVIAVGAVDGGNAHAGFSNYGNEIDLAAPGVNIISSAIGGTYTTKSGTSMAVPFVSGSLAYIESATGVNAYSAYSAMLSTTLDLGSPGFDMYYGYGLIQIHRAVHSLIVIPTAIPTHKATHNPAGYGFAPVTSTVTISAIATQTSTLQVNQSITLQGTPGSQPDTNEVSALAGISSMTPGSSSTPSPTPLPSGEQNKQLSFVCGLGLIGLGILLFTVRKLVSSKN